ncbi:hypothetical protein K2173_017500 [Erythroxylum novogranatense]|uniref:glucan endo-1,3-beta-D-glucosidase n=1 Tax=Erythroxylum novogranatense TaxID=1862640 RepID=A0AAV8TKP6_9ROSI|nr:hypothetical protein K2173_017500 [Erythroxylum novogranatense]
MDRFYREEIGSQIHVTLGVRNEDIPNLATGQEAADSWFQTNVQPYHNDIIFSRITVGYEVIPGTFAANVAPAIQSLQNSLDANIVTRIKLFIFLDHAIFNTTSPLVTDVNLNYYNLFDAMVDAFYSAVERFGVTDIKLVVSDTGWPSDGNGNFTTKELASTYNKNVINHVVTNVTPKRPGTEIETFIFALFNEDQKPPGVEQNFGLFYPTLEPVYDVLPRASFGK